MKITMKSIGAVFKRLSVQIGVIGGTLTTTAASLAAVGVPGADKVAIAGAVLTAAGTVIGAAIPQSSVRTYSPKKEPVIEAAVKVAAEKGSDAVIAALRKALDE